MYLLIQGVAKFRLICEKYKMDFYTEPTYNLFFVQSGFVYIYIS